VIVGVQLAQAIGRHFFGGGIKPPDPIDDLLDGGVKRRDFEAFESAVKEGWSFWNIFTREAPLT